MYKKPNILLGIAVLMTTMNSYTDQRVVEGFIQANYQDKIVSQSPCQDEKPGFISKVLQKIAPLVNKITPKTVLEYRKNSQIRHAMTTQEAARILNSFHSTNGNALEYSEIKNLELVSGQGKTAGSLFSVMYSLMPMQTESGKIQLMNSLIAPSDDIKTLQERQDRIKFLTRHPKKALTFDYYLKEIKNRESSLLEFFSSNPMVSDTESRIVYSKKPLINQIINASPLSYNLTTIVPSICWTLAYPIGVYGFLVAYANLLIYSLKKMVKDNIEKKINEESHWRKRNGELPLNDEEISTIEKEFREKQLESLKKQKLSQEQILKIQANLKDPAISQEDYAEGVMALLGDVVISHGEKIFEGSSNPYGQSIEGINDIFSTLHTITNGGSTKSMLRGAVIPTAFLGYRQSTYLQLIALKSKEIQRYLIDVAEYVYMCECITEEIEKTPELQNTSFGIKFMEFKNNSQLKWLKSLLRRSTFQGSASVLSNWGNVFVTLQEMEKQKEHFIPLIKAVGELDMHCGLTHLMQKHGNNSNQTQFCFAQYVQNDTPTIQAVDFWNPFVLTHKAMQDIITNTISFDNPETQNGIFTGPNTCGKTTVIIAIMLNAILAQTFGIAAAKQFVLTPFGKFNATLTVTTDGAIGDSRFKSEVREAQKVLKNVQDAANAGIFTLTIQDEIFTGTNQRDGEVAAYSFLQKLGKFKNNITLLATHYVDKLTTLGAPFINFKINATVKNATEVIRYYTVSHGISDLNIAHIIAAQAGL